MSNNSGAHTMVITGRSERIFIGGLPAEEASRTVDAGSVCEVDGCDEPARGGTVADFGHICSGHYDTIEG